MLLERAGRNHRRRSGPYHNSQRGWGLPTGRADGV